MPLKNAGTLKFLEKAIAAKTGIPTFHLDKVAFARATVDALTGAVPGIDGDQGGPGRGRATSNCLLKSIALCQRQPSEPSRSRRSQPHQPRQEGLHPHPPDPSPPRGRRRTHRRDRSQLDHSPEAEDVRRRCAPGTQGSNSIPSHASS